MGKIYCLMGKSASGKDTIYNRLLAMEELQLRRVVPYTTRPIRSGETEGESYFFCSEERVAEFEREGKIIELRAYDTMYGVWKYFTADDGQIVLAESDYLMIGTLEAYEQIRAYFGAEHVCPIYVEVDDGNRYLFVGGHHDGRVSMMHLEADGSIGGIADGIFHKGIGRSIAQRNFVPHVDCVKLTPDQKFLCAVDNGLDQVKVYRVDYENGKLELIDIIRGPLESAPRMIRFSRDGEYAYILYELLNIVEVYHYSVQDNEPVFEKIQTISTSPKKEEDICAASGMEISKSGKYLFCSNAGVNSVVCYEIEEKTGMLTPVFTTKVNSDYPKMLAIYPDEKHYLTLNNNSNDIFSYTIDYKDGYSLETGSPVKVDKPNCIYMLKLEAE